MKMLTRNDLQKSDLKLLINDEIQALRIPFFFQSDLCEILINKLLSSSLAGRYINAPLIGRTGRAFYESIDNSILRQDYFDSSAFWISHMRKLCSPYLTPIDLFRLSLDEVWVSGANIATINEKKMFAGLVRTFSSGSYAEPHQDHLEWDIKQKEEDVLLKQLACNIFLKLPKRGGELLIYPYSLSKDEYNDRKIDGSYGVKILSDNQDFLKISPQVGELIIFSSHKVHALSVIEEGEHISWSCFVGFRSESKPLIIWS